MQQKIAVSIRGAGVLDALLDPHFGRAEAFVLTDLDGLAPSRIPNPSGEAAHGAGTGAASTLAQHGVTDVVSGRFGPKAASALEALGIRMWLAAEARTAGVVLAALRADELREQPASGAP
ncbi:MAG: dinitrogenase iron-molybdenum cofactor biosynthesis protein [Deltaproteobacteria bacterium]|nr:dinitrogenase iron-molybdenum cofactor biosynthesis protein [Deltaproteobacteria bacterium]